MENLEKLRPVGRLEQFSTARHTLGFYRNVAVTAAYELPDSCSRPLKSYVYQACAALIGRHPALSAVPVGEDTNNPQWARVPEVNLDSRVVFQSRRSEVRDPSTDGPDVGRDPEADELLASQHNQGFDTLSPVWRLFILTTATRPYAFTAAFVFHHGIGDGASGLAFHRTFQQALSDALAEPSTDPASVIKSPRTPLMPPLESIFPMPLSILFLLKVIFHEKVWAPRRDPGLWTGSNIASPTTTEVRHLLLSSSETSELRDACRAHGATVTTALQTLVAVTLFKHLPASSTKLVGNGALSARRWLPDITDDHMGVWVQSFNEIYSRDACTGDAFPWPEAKRSRQTIENALRVKGRNSIIAMLKFVQNYREELFSSKVGKQRGVSFEVSNVGVFKTSKSTSPDESEKDAQVHVGSMLFTQSANVTGGALSVSVITGGDGCLALGITWQKGVMEDALVEKVIGDLEVELRRLAADVGP